MSSRTVESPAGERIEIVSDEDWILTSGMSPKGLRMWNAGAKRFVIRELWERGSVENKSGRATGELHQAALEHFPDMPETGPTSLTTLMNDSGNSAAFARKTNGKRTYEIALVAMPDLWYQKLMWDIEMDSRKQALNGHSADVDAAEAVAELVMPPTNGGQLGSELVDQLARSTEPDEPEAFIPTVDRSTDEFDDSLMVDVSPPLEIDIASQVAMSLLTTVVEIISAGSPEAMDQRVAALHGDLLEVQQRLAQRLDENQRLRRQLSETGDQVQALKHERDGLRTRVRQLEANLNSALKGDALTAVNGIIQKKVSELMREPASRKVPDA